MFGNVGLQYLQHTQEKLRDLSLVVFDEKSCLEELKSRQIWRQSWQYWLRSSRQLQSGVEKSLTTPPQTISVVIKPTIYLLKHD